jgi:hypothetical protein
MCFKPISWSLASHLCTPFYNFLELKLREENEIVPSFDNLIEDDLVVSDKLVVLTSNIITEFCRVL